MSRTVAQHRPLRVRVVRRVRDAIWSMKDPQDMGYLLGKQYRVRIATAWSRAKQMLKEAKIDLIVANIDQADAGPRPCVRCAGNTMCRCRPSSWRRRSHRRMCSCSKSENVAAFVVFVDGFEAKLTTAVEKVLS